MSRSVELAGSVGVVAARRRRRAARGRGRGPAVSETVTLGCEALRMSIFIDQDEKVGETSSMQIFIDACVTRGVGRY